MASANYWQRGESLDYTNSGSAKIEAGTVIVFGTRIGVAGCDILPGEIGSLHVEGVFEFPLAASTAVTAGAAVYWDATNSVITTTSTNNTLAGYAVKAAASGDATVLVKINA